MEKRADLNLNLNEEEWRKVIDITKNSTSFSSEINDVIEKEVIREMQPVFKGCTNQNLYHTPIQIEQEGFNFNSIKPLKHV